jgi:methylmalonyl-CoA mutase C-terminal domain/subunit
MTEKKIKILVGKPGLDGHDRGAKVIALALRDAGMEVIYTGLHQTIEQIVRTAVQEAVDVIGVIPKLDIAKLKALGVKGVFPGGTPFAEIIKEIKKIVK